MNKIIAYLLNRLPQFIVFSVLTVVTQIGGLVYCCIIYLCRKYDVKAGWKKGVIVALSYLIVTFFVVPIVAPFFGREKIKHTDRIKPTSYSTVLLNRNYVKPKLNGLLASVENKLEDTEIELRYLDANFPFFDGFPLLPHLSHNDGKKLDLSLVYENINGEVVNKKKSISGYGVFEEPINLEYSQSKECIDNGYFQYDYPKYLTFGKINKDLRFSAIGTKKIIVALLDYPGLGKMFIEPHLKSRLELTDQRVKFHGCRAVRHDDHIHIQLK
ncbi:MAG: hypothetical protein ABJO02_08025 [Reichenbachiella sp.]|uniref:hypothetical protein n=1 Tax=Reichenbachiella sp. TaxID=2184521 RepID=UPI003299808F